MKETLAKYGKGEVTVHKTALMDFYFTPPVRKSLKIN